MECLCFDIPCTGAGAAVNPGRQTGISLSPYRRAKVFFFLILDWEALHQLKPEQLGVGLGKTFRRTCRQETGVVGYGP